MRVGHIESLPNRQNRHRHLERAKSGRRQNGLICAASILIGIEPVSIQIGGSRIPGCRPAPIANRDGIA
jgi:hypothetical protein